MINLRLGCIMLKLLLPLCFIYTVRASNLRQISNVDNLSNNSIESFCQDKNGRLWIGTCDGLNLYNGREIEVYQPSDKSQSLSGNLINSILETKENIFWIQTSHGFNKLDWTSKTVKYYGGFKQNIYVTKDKSDRLFLFQEDNFIQYYNENKDAFIKQSVPGVLYDKTLCFVVDMDNRLWFVDKSGRITAYNIETRKSDILIKETFTIKHDLKLQYCFYAQNNLYLVDADYNLYSYNLHNMYKQFHYNLRVLVQQRGEISSLAVSHENIFIGYKTNGVQLLIKNNVSQFGYEVETLPINCGVFTLLKDKNQDIVWIGTDGQGAYIYSNDAYTLKSVKIKDFMPQIGKPVRSIYKDHQNTLWLGTKGDGLIKIGDYDVSRSFSAQKAEVLTISNSQLTDNSVYCMAKSKKNLLWIGTEAGLNYYSYVNKKLEKIEVRDKDVLISYIHDIYEQDSCLWLATVGMGIVKAKIRWGGDTPFLEDIRRIVINNRDMSSNYFFKIYPENDSIIWFANRGHGAFRVIAHNMSYKQFTFSDNNSNRALDDIFALTKSNNAMYFGSGSGLVEYKDNQSFRVLDNTSGFVNNTVHEILTDSTNNSIWLSTNGALINYRPQNRALRNYGIKDGLMVVEFSDGASYKDPASGIMYFGGVNGFVTIQNNHSYDNLYMPRLIFEELTIFGKKENIYDYLERDGQSEKLQLKYTENFITIRVNAIDFLDAHNYTFFYKIQGIHDEWIDNGNSNIISLTNLSSGNYKLDVKYVNRVVGVFSEEYSLAIEILPPWYLSNVAYCIYILLVLYCLFLLFKFLDFRGEKKRRKAIRKLEAQHREQVYESKLDFFTNIAHEFCTPLTLIYGPCNQIIEQPDNAASKKYAKVILRNAQRLNSLIQDLIDFRKLETDGKAPIIEKLNISDIVNEVILRFVEFAKTNNAKFYKTVPQNLVWSTDRNSIVTIVTNLLSNAFKYMSENGSVEIEVKEDADSLIIIISNTGKGIKKQDMDKIFDKHYILETLEGKKSTKLWSRNGLGLAISDNMVKNLKGFISVTSTLNEWTSFTVTLPKLECTVENINREESSTVVSTLSVDPEPAIENRLEKCKIDTDKQTILVIDDELDLLWFISDIFSDKYNVLTVNSPLEVAPILNSFHPDIILCDINMPKLDGIELINIIKSDKQTAHIPLIIISAKHDTEEKIKGINAGAELYITKPFNIEYLKSSVDCLIKRQTTLKEYFASPLSAYELNDGKLLHTDDKNILKEIQNIINTNIRNPQLNADFIAKKLNISTRNLYRKLSQIEYANIKDMIRMSRLHIAESLLLQTKKNVDEIIYESGFTNRVSFYKAFAQKHNCTPKEFRDNTTS